MQILDADDVMEESEILMEEARRRDGKELEEFIQGRDYRTGNFWDYPRKVVPAVAHAVKNRYDRNGLVKDPTRLVLVDEADRLKIPALEQLRHIFDQGDIGLVLIGMPGIEKRLARYPQLYSRVGFVYEFLPLTHAEMRDLLHEHWKANEIGLPDGALDDQDGVAAIIRTTGGNFCLLERLLSQVGRIMAINKLSVVTLEVVEAARESLVIGTA